MSNNRSFIKRFIICQIGNQGIKITHELFRQFSLQSGKENTIFPIMMTKLLSYSEMMILKNRSVGEAHLFSLELQPLQYYICNLCMIPQKSISCGGIFIFTQTSTCAIFTSFILWSWYQMIKTCSQTMIPAGGRFWILPVKCLAAFIF